MLLHNACILPAPLQSSKHERVFSDASEEFRNCNIIFDETLRSILLLVTVRYFTKFQSVIRRSEDMIIDSRYLTGRVV